MLTFSRNSLSRRTHALSKTETPQLKPRQHCWAGLGTAAEYNMTSPQFFSITKEPGRDAVAMVVVVQCAMHGAVWIEGDKRSALLSAWIYQLATVGNGRTKDCDMHQI